MSTELLRLDGVSRQYGHGETARTALAGIDLTIMAGEMVAVMGALIIAMVAIPVAGLSGVALVGLSMVPTVDETIAVELGQADARINMISSPDPSMIQSPRSARVASGRDGFRWCSCQHPGGCPAG
ncbi:hypothetical protein [Cryobacterium sp. Y82]|uniref:hypothetical protein n=1 Tax=Cryobacterium sp. Y82 TaxID=2045017 RepID=UPI000CE3B568|nr:hypothetical protein [Cryobacterium sp. Y82]